MSTTQYCDNCGEAYTSGWTVSNYYGVSGEFCSPCYRKISHDSYGNPNNPGEYLTVLLKQKYSVDA